MIFWGVLGGNLGFGVFGEKSVFEGKKSQSWCILGEKNPTLEEKNPSFDGKKIFFFGTFWGKREGNEFFLLMSE